MKISSKGRNAVRIMEDIAKKDGEFVSIGDISRRQNITVKYCERIISMLVKGKLLQSMRGTNGGYKLARPAKDISIYEILCATGDNTKLAKCTMGSNCDKMEKCDAMQVWVKLDNLINDYLKGVSLENLIKM